MIVLVGAKGLPRVLTDSQEQVDERKAQRTRNH